MLYSSWWTWWRCTWKLNEENDDDAGDADGVAPAWGHLDEKALVHRLCYLCRCWWHLHSWCASDFSTTTSKEILELSLKPGWDARVIVDTKPQTWANIWRQHQNGLRNMNELCTVPNVWLLSQQHAACFWFENRGWAMLGQYCLHNELAAEFHHILKYSDSPTTGNSDCRKKRFRKVGSWQFPTVNNRHSWSNVFHRPWDPLGVTRALDYTVDWSLWRGCSNHGDFNHDSHI